MKPTAHRWVHATWCDDIRHEIGNKPSFMGVYTNGLAVPSFPTLLRGLSIFVEVYTPENQPFEKFCIRIMQADKEKPIGQMEMQPEHLAALRSSENSTSLDPTEPASMGLGLAMLLGPLEITESTEWLKVWVDTEGEPLESFKLKVLTGQAVAQGPV